MATTWSRQFRQVQLVHEDGDVYAIRISTVIRAVDGATDITGDQAHVVLYADLSAPQKAKVDAFLADVAAYVDGTFPLPA